MGHVRFTDEGFVSGIEKDQRVVVQGIVHPFLQLLTGESRTRRIIGITQVNQIYPMIGKFGNKPVLTGTRQVSDLAPQTVRSGNSRTSAHDITVHIHRIYRIGNGDEIILTEKFGKVSQVALRSVADKDFRRTESDAPLFEVVFQNGFDQEVISLFRPVAVECTGIRQFPDGPAHRLDASLGKRTGHRFPDGSDVPADGRPQRPLPCGPLPKRGSFPEVVKSVRLQMP